MSAPRHDDDLFALTDARLAAGFVGRSVARHWRLAAAVAAAVVAATAVLYVTWPRTYHTEVRLLAQRNLVMPALGNPRRTVPADSDAPTRLAAETVMKRENLLSVIDATRLTEEWDRTRAPILKLKDRILRPFGGAPSPEDKLEALVGLLRKKAWVSADEGTVTIGIDWRNAATACRIVERMQQNFLEERHASEVSSIADAISILEGHAATVRGAIESAAAEVRRAPAPAPRRVSVARVPSPPRAAPAAPADAALTSLEVLREGKQRVIADLEDFRQKRLAQLHTQLAEQKNTYGPAHPAIAETEESIEAVSAESPQIATLKREVSDLAEEIRKRGEEMGASAPAREIPAAGVAGSAATVTLLPEPADPPLSYPQSRLKSAINAYEDLLQRLEGARIELDTARAAFKYRYGVILPAQVPKKPVSPTPLFLALGLLLAVGSGVAAATAADLRDRRILESWQVERFLGADVLAEIARP